MDDLDAATFLSFLLDWELLFDAPPPGTVLHAKQVLQCAISRRIPPASIFNAWLTQRLEGIPEKCQLAAGQEFWLAALEVKEGIHISRISGITPPPALDDVMSRVADAMSSMHVATDGRVVHMSIV